MTHLSICATHLNGPCTCGAADTRSGLDARSNVIPLAYPASRYGDRTICDPTLPDMQGDAAPAWLQEQSRNRRAWAVVLDDYHFIFRLAVITTICAFILGIIFMTLWGKAYPLKDSSRQIIGQEQGFADGDRGVRVGYLF